LNKGESIHSLRRFLLFACQVHLRHEELSHQSACLTLLTNAVITGIRSIYRKRWRSLCEAGIDSKISQGETIASDVIAHLSPARYENGKNLGNYAVRAGLASSTLNPAYHRRNAGFNSSLITFDRICKSKRPPIVRQWE
jgi:Tn3 transposase DDE domain